MVKQRICSYVGRQRNKFYDHFEPTGLCTDHYSVSISLVPVPIISISGPDTVCAGDLLVLYASGSDNYLWSTGSSFNGTSIYPSTTAVYTVTGTNSQGCISENTKKVSVLVCQALDENSAGLPIKIYPNPSAGIFIAETDLPTTLLFYNELGQKIKEVKILKGITELTVEHEGLLIIRSERDSKIFKLLIRE
jgi:hypothetical protein